jgi:hypothetical protein
MATIDKASIKVQKTSDPLVFNLTFDFTDDPALDANEAWKSTWFICKTVYNTNMTTQEFETLAGAAMETARKPAAETTLETTFRSTYGTTVIRTDPTVTSTPMEVKLVAVDAAVVVKTQEQV